MTVDNIPIVLAGGTVALAACYKDFLSENWETLAAVTGSVLLGELAARFYCYAKSRSNVSNLKDHYNISSYFSKCEKAALVGAVPLTAVIAKNWPACSKIFLSGSIIHFFISVYRKPPAIVVKEQLGRNLNGIYYGPAMAYSYFYGYLKLIICPERGNSFVQNVTKYVEEQKGDESTINIPDKRLYILTPLSGECFSSLSEISDEWIISTKTSSTVLADRGAVKGRSYHNTMHRIKRPDSMDMPIYVCGEFATPLITYKEACKMSNEPGLTEYTRETILSFHETLARLIEQDATTRENIKLILYEDRDEQGKTVNIAKILLGEIAKVVAASTPSTSS